MPKKLDLPKQGETGGNGGKRGKQVKGSRLSALGSCPRGPARDLAHVDAGIHMALSEGSLDAVCALWGMDLQSKAGKEVRHQLRKRFWRTKQFHGCTKLDINCRAGGVNIEGRYTHSCACARLGVESIHMHT